MWTGIRSGLLISMLGKLNWFLLTGPITMVLLMWKWMGLFFRKNNLLRYWSWPSLLNWVGALTLFLLQKLPPRKLEKFLSPKVALYLYKSTMGPCMQYCCHVWAGTPSCYLELLDILLKWICRTVGPSLVASLGPLVHHWNVAVVPLPYFRPRSARHSDRLHNFSVSIPRCYKNVNANSFFPPTAQLDSGILCL